MRKIYYELPVTEEELELIISMVRIERSNGLCKRAELLKKLIDAQKAEVLAYDELRALCGDGHIENFNSPF